MIFMHIASFSAICFLTPPRVSMPITIEGSTTIGLPLSGYLRFNGPEVNGLIGLPSFKLNLNGKAAKEENCPSAEQGFRFIGQAQGHPFVPRVGVDGIFCYDPNCLPNQECEIMGHLTIKISSFIMKKLGFLGTLKGNLMETLKGIK
jgi:hypothetical protein